MYVRPACASVGFLQRDRLPNSSWPPAATVSIRALRARSKGPPGLGRKMVRCRSFRGHQAASFNILLAAICSWYAPGYVCGEKLWVVCMIRFAF
jgi:hypothetical protein